MVDDKNNEQSGPIAGERADLLLVRKSIANCWQKLTRKIGCGKQTARSLVQEGSQPRYGEDVTRISAA